MYRHNGSGRTLPTSDDPNRHVDTRFPFHERVYLKGPSQGPFRVHGADTSRAEGNACTGGISFPCGHVLRRQRSRTNLQAPMQKRRGPQVYLNTPDVSLPPPPPAAADPNALPPAALPPPQLAGAQKLDEIGTDTKVSSDATYKSGAIRNGAKIAVRSHGFVISILASSLLMHDQLYIWLIAIAAVPVNAV